MALIALLGLCTSCGGSPPPTDRQEFEALQGEFLSLAVSFDALGDRLPEPPERLNKRLDPVLTTIARALRGWGKLKALGQEYSTLVDRVRAETD